MSKLLSQSDFMFHVFEVPNGILVETTYFNDSEHIQYGAKKKYVLVKCPSCQFGKLTVGEMA